MANPVRNSIYIIYLYIVLLLPGVISLQTSGPQTHRKIAAIFTKKRIFQTGPKTKLYWCLYRQKINNPHQQFIISIIYTIQKTQSDNP